MTKLLRVLELVASEEVVTIDIEQARAIDVVGTAQPSGPGVMSQKFLGSK
jgi:hypothetical protein